MPAKHCVILGGGFSGLCCAHYIRKLNPIAKVTVVESTNRVGGWVKSFQSSSGAVHEVGPRSIRNTYNARLILNMISDLGLQDHLISPAKDANNRYLYVNDSLQKLPPQLWQKGPFQHTLPYYLFIHLKLAYLSKQRSHKTISSEDVDETIYDFVSKQFGNEVADVAFSALVRGIFAGDINKLSVKSCFPHFHKALTFSPSFIMGMIKLEKLLSQNPHIEINSKLGDQLKSHKSRMFSLKPGLEVLPREILAHLKKSEQFFDIKFNKKCETIQSSDSKNIRFKLFLSEGETIECDDIVFTLPSMELRELLSRSSFPNPQFENSTLESFLKSVEYANVAVVNFEFNSKSVAHVPKAFGYLVPIVQKSNVIGVTFDSFSFPQVSNGYMDNNRDVVRFTAMLNECSPEFSDQDYINKALIDFSKHLRIEDEPNFASVNVNWNCIPQYAVGHTSMVDKLKQHFNHFHFLGPLFHPPGLVDCSFNAFKVANLVALDNKV